MQASKNGFFYVLDRRTGELLSAKNYTVLTADDSDAIHACLIEESWKAYSAQQARVERHMQ